MRFALSLFLFLSLSMPVMANKKDDIKKLEKELQLVVSSSDWKSIIESSDKLLSIMPYHPIANLEKGKALIELGKYNEALKPLKMVYTFFDTSIRYNYQHEFSGIISAQASYYRAKCLEHLGDLEFAIIKYNSAIIYGYDNPQVHADLERVTKKYNEQLPKDPYSVKIRELEKKLRYASFERSKWKKIVSAADELLALEPQHPIAHLEKARALMNGGNNDEDAVKSFDKAIKYHHLEKRFKTMIIRESFYYRGQSLRALGRLEEALESFDLAIMHGLDHRYIYNERSEVQMELGLELD